MKIVLWAPDLATVSRSGGDAGGSWPKLVTLKSRFAEAQAMRADLFVVPELYFARAMSHWDAGDDHLHAFGPQDFVLYCKTVHGMSLASPNMLIVAGTMLYQATDGYYYNKCLYAYKGTVAEQHKATCPAAEKRLMTAPTNREDRVRCNNVPFARIAGPGGFEFSIEICADSGDASVPSSVDIAVVCACRLGPTQPVARRVEIVCDGGGQSRVNLPSAGTYLATRHNFSYGLHVVTISDAHVQAIRAARLAPPPLVVAAPVARYVPPHLRNRPG
ncbi:MAG: hypothetical protein QOH06_4907 [Acidobacteriota bacterium]|jgi:hypothetical protein|nr:hypothetical protein [Acidobacteriota bacterium]